MLTRTIVAPVAVALAITVVGLVSVAQGQSQAGRGSLTALDYAEIEQLYGRYAIGVDSGNSDMFASVFTADGVFEVAGRTFQGRKQLAGVAAPGPGKGPNNVSHVIVNTTIDPSPEGATGTAYYLRVTPGPDGQPVPIVAAGIYRDMFVKTAEGWRIKKRVAQRAELPAPAK